MSKFNQGDPSTKDYWEQRVLNAPNEKDMLFLDPRREEFWERVRGQLSVWCGKSVLDVCCGYGQFATIFSNYEGIDFSENMIALAKKKYSQHDFRCIDIKTHLPNRLYDVIFEVNSLRSLGWSPEDFNNRFKEYAKIIVCLEADRFTIFQSYDKRKTD